MFVKFILDLFMFEMILTVLSSLQKMKRILSVGDKGFSLWLKVDVSIILGGLIFLSLSNIALALGIVSIDHYFSSDMESVMMIIKQCVYPFVDLLIIINLIALYWSRVSSR